MKDTRLEPNLLTQGTASAAPYYFICVCARPLMSFAPHQITDTGKQEYTLHIPLAESRKVGSERRAVGAVLACSWARCFSQPQKANSLFLSLLGPRFGSWVWNFGEKTPFSHPTFLSESATFLQNQPILPRLSCPMPSNP